MVDWNRQAAMLERLAGHTSIHAAVLSKGWTYTPYGGVVDFWAEESRRIPTKVESFTDVIREQLNSGIISELPAIPDDFNDHERKEVIGWLTARGTPGFGPMTFVPCGGRLARREMWSAEMTPEGYDALLWGDRKWIARMWDEAAGILV